jgi:hypothetical protein
LLSQEGREIPISQVIIAHKGSSGRVQYLSAISCDMTERKRAVQQLTAGETLMPLEEVVGLLRYTGRTREEEYEACQAIEKLTLREIEVFRLWPTASTAKGRPTALHIHQD